MADEQMVLGAAAEVVAVEGERATWRRMAVHRMHLSLRVLGLRGLCTADGPGPGAGGTPGVGWIEQGETAERSARAPDGHEAPIDGDHG